MKQQRIKTNKTHEHILIFKKEKFISVFVHKNPVDILATSAPLI